MFLNGISTHTRSTKDGGLERISDEEREGYGTTTTEDYRLCVWWEWVGEGSVGRKVTNVIHQRHRTSCQSKWVRSEERARVGEIGEKRRKTKIGQWRLYEERRKKGIETCFFGD